MSSNLPFGHLASILLSCFSVEMLIATSSSQEEDTAFSHSRDHVVIFSRILDVLEYTRFWTPAPMLLFAAECVI